ncbi:MAG: hypothetical protein RRY36_07940 [Bacteroidaceae bacterium]
MDNKFFMVYVEGESTPTLKHTSKEGAEKEAKRLSNKLGKKVFVLGTDLMVIPDEINIKVDSYEAALEYLGRKGCVCIQGIAKKHEKAMAAMHKLITIAEAWNKVDEFVPDYGNTNQYKWFPWFIYSDDAAGFVPTDTKASVTAAPVGSRLCFKTEERATQFGKQFIDLWNDFLL